MFCCVCDEKSIDMEKVFGLRRRFTHSCRVEKKILRPQPRTKMCVRAEFSACRLIRGGGNDIDAANVHLSHQTDAHKRTGRVRNIFGPV